MGAEGSAVRVGACHVATASDHEYINEGAIKKITKSLSKKKAAATLRKRRVERVGC